MLLRNGSLGVHIHLIIIRRQIRLLITLLPLHFIPFPNILRLTKEKVIDISLLRHTAIPLPQTRKIHLTRLLPLLLLFKILDFLNSS